MCHQWLPLWYIISTAGKSLQVSKCLWTSGAHWLFLSEHSSTLVMYLSGVWICFYVRRTWDLFWCLTSICRPIHSAQSVKPFFDHSATLRFMQGWRKLSPWKKVLRFVVFSVLHTKLWPRKKIPYTVTWFITTWLLQKSPQNSLLCLAITLITWHLWFKFFNTGVLTNLFICIKLHKNKLWTSEVFTVFKNLKNCFSKQFSSPDFTSQRLLTASEGSVYSYS